MRYKMNLSSYFEKQFYFFQKKFTELLNVILNSKFSFCYSFVMFQWLLAYFSLWIQYCRFFHKYFMSFLRQFVKISWFVINVYIPAQLAFSEVLEEHIGLWEEPKTKETLSILSLFHMGELLPYGRGDIGSHTVGVGFTVPINIDKRYLLWDAPSYFNSITVHPPYPNF